MRTVVLSTGVSVQHEHDTDDFVINFHQNEFVAFELHTNVETARMLKEALESMKVLEEKQNDDLSE